MRYHVASSSRPCHGETANGDLALVRELPNGALLAVVDGLGHGPEAARAAALAESVLREHAPDGPAVLIDAVHAALRGTRGAAVTLALLRDDEVVVAGVGNVALQMRGGLKLDLRLTAGIVGGAPIRRLRTQRVTVTAPTRLIMYSDGVSDFDSSALAPLDPERACKQLIDAHSLLHDDATALVADLRPGPG